MGTKTSRYDVVRKDVVYVIKDALLEVEGSSDTFSETKTLAELSTDSLAREEVKLYIVEKLEECGYLGFDEEDFDEIDGSVKVRDVIDQITNKVRKSKR